MVVPHPLKFSRESRNWGGGGVCFLDVYAAAAAAPPPPGPAGRGAAAAATAPTIADPSRTILRCYNVSLAQFNHVVAEENGGDGAGGRAVIAVAPRDLAELVARGPGASRDVAPGWYGTVVYLGDAGDAPDGGGGDGGGRVPLLTFTSPASFFAGRGPPHNPPSPAHRAVLLAGLQEVGLSEREAQLYLAARDGAGVVP
jgi:hypothetical protein